jgi:P3 major capsid protein
MQPSNQPSPAQLNQIARAAIKARAVLMTQQIFSATYGSGGGTVDVSTLQPVVNVIPRNVGLIKGFWVQITGTFLNPDTTDSSDLSDFGPANILSQIQFNDLNNNTRIQTTGWHMAFINSIKARRPFGASLISHGVYPSVPGGTQTGIQTPVNYGASWSGTIQAAGSTPPATAIAHGATGTCTMWWWIPLAYSDDDLRGAIYANVVNATMQLNLTFNPSVGALPGTDSTSAVYLGATGQTAKNIMVQAVVNVYQEYWDQLPTGKGGVLLPVLDLATIYEFKNTIMSSINANQDFPVQYANFRDFMSTTAVYVQASATGARGVGADINYWALQSANFTNIWKKSPGLIGTQTRNHLQTDMPPGAYYFGSRQKPISTVQYGNMELVLNAITAGTGAYLLLGYEDFALVQTLSMAGSLAAS